MSKLVSLLAFTAMLTLVFLIAFWLWKKLWFDKFGGKSPVHPFEVTTLKLVCVCLAEIPVDRN